MTPALCELERGSGPSRLRCRSSWRASERPQKMTFRCRFAGLRAGPVNFGPDLPNVARDRSTSAQICGTSRGTGPLRHDLPDLVRSPPTSARTCRTSSGTRQLRHGPVRPRAKSPTSERICRTSNGTGQHRRGLVGVRAEVVNFGTDLPNLARDRTASAQSCRSLPGPGKRRTMFRTVTARPVAGGPSPSSFHGATNGTRRKKIRLCEPETLASYPE